MSEKKVLIVTYYWPPSGGSGVQRWLKTVKYLPQFGWKPYVFTPENPSFAIKDVSLFKDVPKEAEIIHFPIWEPYDIFFSITGAFGKKKSAKPTELVSGKEKSFFQKISTWLRGNLLIPDPRVFWVKPSVKFLQKYISENDIKIIITTGPPHSMHLIGLKLKKQNPSLKWIADFRDPWSEWGLLDSLMVGTVARARHQKLEKKVLQSADEVTTITPFYERRFSSLAGRPVKLFTNGFDADDFKNISYKKTERFILRHVGIINEKCDPRPLMRAIHTLLKEDPDFAARVQVEFIGEVHGQFRNYVEENSSLSVITKFSGNIPHKELISQYGNSSLLVLVLHGYKDAEGYMPGKLFEYLATGIPVLGVGPVSGDASDLLMQTQAGRMFDANDQAGIVSFIKNSFRKWIDVETPAYSKTNADLYSRRKITERLTELLNSLT